MPRPRQVFAFSGLLSARPGERPRALVDHAVSLAGDGPKQVCFVPTAVGDARHVIESVSALLTGCPEVEFSVLTLFTQPSVPDVRAHLLSQDVLLVGGGSEHVRAWWVEPTADGGFRDEAITPAGSDMSSSPCPRPPAGCAGAKTCHGCAIRVRRPTLCMHSQTTYGR